MGACSRSMLSLLSNGSCFHDGEEGYGRGYGYKRGIEGTRMGQGV